MLTTTSSVQQASHRKMVTEYGMSEKLGPMQFGQSQQGQVFLGRDLHSEQNYSDAIAHEIDNEIQRFIKESYEAVHKQILTENRDKLRACSSNIGRSRNVRRRANQPTL